MREPTEKAKTLGYAIYRKSSLLGDNVDLTSRDVEYLHEYLKEMFLNDKKYLDAKSTPDNQQ